MPRRNDIKKILVIGAGPIVIGQACEFDYSGTQGIKALKEEGYKVILINSNPATIMTDPNLADAVYIEPITPEFIESIIIKEKPDAILPTLGGQTALNAALELYDKGILDKYKVKLIGASIDAIRKAEDRKLFKEAMEKIGLACPKSFIATSLEEALQGLESVGLPAIIRPALTLGGSGGGVANTLEEYKSIIISGLDASPITQVLVDQSIIGWKEFEMEVVRDKNDNCIIICSIENLDPMGTHTGDSVTVAPALTLTDKEYQKMRDASFAILREVGVETGGSNVQFAVNPKDGEMLVIEMNPRVSRSSALASKATGFPIAKIASKLAVGYTLDELRNDLAFALPEGVSLEEYKYIYKLKAQGLTKQEVAKKVKNKKAINFAFANPHDIITQKELRQKIFPAAFEPTIDYVVVKMPKFAFKKFGVKDPELGTQMQSIGESMAIGRSFEEAFLKALNSLEGIDSNFDNLTQGEFRSVLAKRVPDRCVAIMRALEAGLTVSEICNISGFDKWFVERLKNIVNYRVELKSKNPKGEEKDISKLITEDEMLKLKQLGFRDAAIREYLNIPADANGRHLLGEYRKKIGITPVFKRIDTCAAEFESSASYFYSSYEKPSYQISEGSILPVKPVSDAINVSDKKKIVIIGSGPNRIGQGIEFDYSCVHAAFAARDAGVESVMINCNPETVSTDYDTSDRLYFEPLVFEYVQAVIENEMGPELHSIYNHALNNNFVFKGSYKGKPVEINTKQELESFLSSYIGVLVQFGGQTPLKLCQDFKTYAIPVYGTPVEQIKNADDRGFFEAVCSELKIKRPDNYFCKTYEELLSKASELDYSFIVRPSSVLGGRGMKIIQTKEEFDEYLAFEGKMENVLLDKFIRNAKECDLDLIRDKSGDILICGLLEHIEYAGVHSGDSACSLPTYSISKDKIKEIYSIATKLADKLDVVGFMNLQLAIKDKDIFVIEVNPRASRTIPFIAKACGLPLSKIATKVILNFDLKDIEEFKKYKKVSKIKVFKGRHVYKVQNPKLYSVKEAVFSFEKMISSETILGPEMKSTGEVMGTDKNFYIAYAKAIVATRQKFKTSGNAFVSISSLDKNQGLVSIVKNLQDAGFNICATTGTADFLRANKLKVTNVHKVAESEENIVKMINSNQIDLVINTTCGLKSISDSFSIRRAAVVKRVPYFTNIEAADVIAKSLRLISKKKIELAKRIYKIS